MKIILNEYDYAENLISSHSLGSTPGESLFVVAKYCYATGKTKKETERFLEEYLLRCDPNINLHNWTKIIDSCVKSAKKSKMLELDGVSITQKELDICRSLDGALLQRLMFTLICIAKFYYYAYGTVDGWVNRKNGEIFSSANIVISSKKQNELFYTLYKAGLIRYSKKVDNLNVAVCELDFDGDPAYTVTDYRNLGNQYRMLLGEPYFVCSECGITIRKTANNQKYCPVCADVVNKAKIRDRYYE